MSDRKSANRAKQVAEEGRKIQAAIDRKSKSKSPAKQQKAVQAGQRDYPVELDEVHLEKPGREADLPTPPMYEAPLYAGSAKLKGMNALISGGDSGIGRAVAVLFAREGANVAIAYLEEESDADETKRAVEAEGAQCLLLAGDVSDPAFCEQAVERTLKSFGSLDILVNNAAFQEHASDIADITDEHFDRTLKQTCTATFTLRALRSRT